MVRTPATLRSGPRGRWEGRLKSKLSALLALRMSLGTNAPQGPGLGQPQHLPKIPEPSGPLIRPCPPTRRRSLRGHVRPASSRAELHAGSVAGLGSDSVASGGLESGPRSLAEGEPSLVRAYSFL